MNRKGMGPRYSIYHPLVMSFYSRGLYRDVLFRWKGFGLLYLFMLVSLTSLLRIAPLQLEITRYVESYGEQLAAQVPDIELKGGEVLTDAPQPVVIYDPEDGKPLVVIDTGAGIDALDGTAARFLVTKNRAYIKRNNTEIRTYNLSRFDDTEIDKEDVLWALDTAKGLLAPALFLILVLVTYVSSAFLFFAYGLALMVITKAWKHETQFPSATRLSIVACTPATLIGVAVSLLNIHIPLFWVIKQLIVIAYIGLAVKWCSEPENKTVR